MSLDFAAMSELEAVNAMLAAAGITPVSSFDPNIIEAVGARQKLHEVSRKVQSVGWEFNLEFRVPYLLNAGGISVGQNVLGVRESDPVESRNRYTLRGNRLWNRKTRTFIFTDKVTLDHILFLPWIDLPTVAREYIVLLAALEFQNDILGDSSTDKALLRRADRAFVALRKAEGYVRHANILTGTAHLNQTVVRWG